MDLKERGLDLLLDSMTDLVAAAKLQFGLSTGAVVFFVHQTTELHHQPVRTGILSLAAVFFGFSAVQCIQALVHLSKWKAAIGNTIWRDVEKRGELFLEQAKEDIAGAQRKFSKMDRFFYAGVAWSVVFVVVQFVSSLQ
jgi:hypothetical protein